MRVSVVGAVTDADAAEVWALHDAVFADQPSETAWREAVWDRHTVRAGFRLARAHDDLGPTGFAYGYTGDRGQWWTDRAAEALDEEVASAWLGGHFEVVSIGVLERARGRGTGRRLLGLLLEGLPHDRLLLMTTADPADPARRLYASEGWRVLGPGVGPGTVILGKQGAGPDRDRARTTASPSRG